MTEKTQEIVIVQRIRAKNDPSGNPRRGWLVHFHTARCVEFIGFVDEGYRGESYIRTRFPGCIALGAVAVTTRQYLDALKVETRVSGTSRELSAVARGGSVR